MQIALVSSFAFALVIGIAFLMRTRLVSVDTNAAVLDVFALAARYRPMLRLLDGSDFEILNESGDRSLARKMRRQRRIIFRGYLRSLNRDHSRLCQHVRELIVNSDCDRSDLASGLFQLQMTFQLLFAGIQVRLMLHALGVGNVDANALIHCFEQIRRQAEVLSVTAAPASVF